MLKVNRSIPRFNPEHGAKLTTWIWQIAHNTGVDHVRRAKQSRKLPEIPLDDTTDKKFQREYARDWFREREKSELAGLQSTENEAIIPDNVRRMRNALSALSESDRSILVLRLSMEYEEIAQVEGVTVGAIRTRHSRAVERLRTQYEKGDKLEQ